MFKTIGKIKTTECEHEAKAINKLDPLERVTGPTNIHGSQSLTLLGIIRSPYIISYWRISDKLEVIRKWLTETIKLNHISFRFEFGWSNHKKAQPLLCIEWYLVLASIGWVYVWLVRI